MFNQLEGNGRVWVYTSDRPLTQAEQDHIYQKVTAFCKEWAAHGAQLKSQFELISDHFLVLAVDEDFEAASGCSIDTSVQIFRELSQDLNIDLFNRMNLAFSIADEVKIIKMAELNTAVQEGLINEDTFFYDNSISDLNSLRNNWKKPIKDSWLQSRLKQIA